MAWSITPDRSWSYLNRGLVYVAFALIGLFLAAAVRRPAPAVAAVLTPLLLGAVVVWALAGKVIPGLYPDGARIARLRSPIGYWNALALACAIALPVFLWLSARVRAAAAVGVYLSLLALLLTYSRGGVAVAVVGVVLWLAAGSGRSESLAALAISVPVGLAVGGIGLALPGVAEDLSRTRFASPTAGGSDSRWSSGLHFRRVAGKPSPRPPRAAGAGGPGGRARRRGDRRAGRTRRLPLARISRLGCGSGASEPEPAHLGELEQPLDVVAGGLAALRAQARRR